MTEGSNAVDDGGVQPERSIIIRPNDSSLSVAQAIYHHVTAKTERIFENYDKSYIVTDTDISQIYHIIKQVAQRHHEEEFSCTIDHALFKKERIIHSSFEKFSISDRGHAAPTSEIVISYDFLSKNPLVKIENEIKPERYKVTITISRESQLRADDPDSSDDGLYQRYFGYPAIYVRIEYVDYTIARSLLSAIREWVDGLDGKNKPKLSSLILRNGGNLFYSIPAVFAASALLGVGKMASLSRYSPNNLIDFSNVFLIMAVSILMYGFGMILATAIYSANSYSLCPTFILITNGDRINKDKKIAKIAKSKELLYFLIFSVFLVLALNVLSSYIYDYLK